MFISILESQHTDGSAKRNADSFTIHNFLLEYHAIPFSNYSEAKNSSTCPDNLSCSVCSGYAFDIGVFRIHVAWSLLNIVHDCFENVIDIDVLTLESNTTSPLICHSHLVT